MSNDNTKNLGELSQLLTVSNGIVNANSGLTSITKPSSDNSTNVATTSFTQVLAQTSSSIIASAGGSSDTITGLFTPGIGTLTSGMIVSVRAAVANTSTTPTFQANSTAAKVIVKGNNIPLSPGDIAGDGHWIELQYDQTLDKWVILNPATGVSGSITLLNQNNTWNKAQRGLVTTVPFSGSISLDLNLSNNFFIVLTGSATLANPTNMVAGQSGIVTISQDASGNRPLSYGSAWKFIGAVLPSLSTYAWAIDQLVYYVQPNSTSIFTILNKDIR